MCAQEKLALLQKEMTQKEISRRFYLNRKNNNLCPRCGKELDRSGHYCSECLEKSRIYQNDTREFMRSMGICPECRKNKSWGDKKRCIECKLRSHKYIKPKSDKQKESFRIWEKEKYRQRAEMGICTRCGKRKAAPLKKKCEICLEKDRQIHSKRMWEKRNEQRIKEKEEA